MHFVAKKPKNIYFYTSIKILKHNTAVKWISRARVEKLCCNLKYKLGENTLNLADSNIIHGMSEHISSIS